MSGFSSPPPKLPLSLKDGPTGRVLEIAHLSGSAMGFAWSGERRFNLTDSGMVMAGPLRDMNGDEVLAPLGMAGETYQDLSASRADRTTYQNTTSRMIVVCVAGLVPDGRGATYGMVSHDGSTWFAVAAIMYDNADGGAMTMHVPPGAYYRTNDRLNISSWREFRT